MWGPDMLSADAHDGETPNLPGIYAALKAEAIANAAAVDPRIRPTNTDPRWQDDYTPHLSPRLRSELNESSPVTKSARRELEAFERGEPYRVAFSRFPFRTFPQARSITFLRSHADTAAEQGELAWLVWIWPNDDITVGQSRAQRDEENMLRANVSPVGEVDQRGDYWPLKRGDDGEWWRAYPDGTLHPREQD